MPVGWPDWKRPGPGQFAFTEVPIPAVGAGVDFDLIVPSGEQWRVVQVACRLTTSAAVANRRPVLGLVTGAGGGALAEVYPDRVQVASIARNYLWTRGAGVPWAEVTVSPQLLVIPLPDLIVVGQGDVLVSTLNLQAGDQWAPMWVRYELV